jgi:hypothetical protein
MSALKTLLAERPTKVINSLVRVKFHAIGRDQPLVTSVLNTCVHLRNLYLETILR